MKNKKLQNFVSIWAGPVILAAMFVFLLAVSWRKWPDILIDFGHELYIPWQLMSGRVLYSDIAHLYGPFSQYINSLLLACFGVSLSTICTANILLIAGLLVLLYTAFAKLFDRLTAFTCCAIVLMIFTFSQLGGTGNYNFVCPYSHEATHGLILSGLLMLMLWRFARNRHNRWLVLSGVVLGCIFMTRAEVALAACLYVLCFLGLNLRSSCAGECRLTKRLFFLSSGFVVLPIIFFGMFKRTMSYRHAGRAVGGAWTALLNGDVISNQFFISGLGFDHPLANIVSMLTGAAVAAMVTALVLWLLRLIGKGAMKDSRAALFSLLVLVLFLAGKVDLYSAGHSLPVLIFVILLLLARTYLKTLSGSEPIRQILSLSLSFSVFSSALLTKMVLNCRLYHYGFYLTLPSAVLIGVFLMWYLPRFVLSSGRNRRAFRFMALAAVLIFGARYVQASLDTYRLRTLPVGRNGDRIVTFGARHDARGRIVLKILQWIDENMEPEASFAVLPEGVMINYLSRRRSTSAYTTFMMTEMLAFGEETILYDIQVDPPDYIIIVHKDTSEFGVGFFGADPFYGMQIMNWVKQRYKPVFMHGREPLTNNYFGIKVMRYMD